MQASTHVSRRTNATSRRGTKPVIDRTIAMSRAEMSALLRDPSSLLLEPAEQPSYINMAADAGDADAPVVFAALAAGPTVSKLGAATSRRDRGDAVRACLQLPLTPLVDPGATELQLQLLGGKGAMRAKRRMPAAPVLDNIVELPSVGAAVERDGAGSAGARRRARGSGPRHEEAPSGWSGERRTREQEVAPRGCQRRAPVAGVDWTEPRFAGASWCVRAATGYGRINVV